MVRTKKVRFSYFFTSGSLSFQGLIWNDSKFVFVVENFFGLYFSAFLPEIILIAPSPIDASWRALPDGYERRG